MRSDDIGGILQSPESRIVISPIDLERVNSTSIRKTTTGTILLTSTLMVLFFSSIFTQAYAANWYVRPSGGSGTGTSWTAAWNGFGAINWGSVSCGDTIWVAGGNYSQDLILQKKCTSGTRLNIRRARSDSAECTGAAGWSSGFASTVRQVATSIQVMGDVDYVTVSGRTTANGGGHGWHLDFSGTTGGQGIYFANGADGDYNTFENMDIQGPGNVTYTQDGRGLDITPFASPNQCTGNTFSHLKIWNWESGIYNVWADGSIYEYIDMYDMNAVNWQSYHPNGIYIASSSGGIVRYSRFHRGPAGYSVGEGIFFEQAGGCSNWKIYGNVFYDIDQSHWKSIQITSSVSDLLIYNNTFHNSMNTVYVNAGSCTGSSATKNNLFYNSSSGSCGTTSSNLSTSSTVFVNASAHDYHIVSTTGSAYPRNAGTNLSAYFSTDPDGVGFGGDGSWDIGAYEYNSGSGSLPPPPPPPPSLIPTPPGGLQIN